MATSPSSASKRNSLHKLSNIFQLASPSFSRPSFDSQWSRPTRNKPKARDSHTDSSFSTATDTRDNTTFNPTASIVSHSASLATGHTPLIDSNRPISPDPVPPVPTTTNDLAVEDKMKLVKKSRKISRVLGEVPLLATPGEGVTVKSPKRLSDVFEDPAAAGQSPSRPTSPTMNMQAVSASAKKAFRRSLTFAGSSALAGNSVHRSKSMSTLRPSLHCTSPALPSDNNPPYSPILFASNAVTSSNHSVEALDSEDDDLPPLSAVCEPQVPSQSNQSRTHRSDSTVSSILPLEQTREQIQRQRMERLARMLGDSVPPDILRRAASPSAEQSAPSEMYRVRDGSHVMSMESLPQRSTSLRAKIPPKRRRPHSLDFKNVRDSGIMSAPTTPLDSPIALPPAAVRRAMLAQGKGHGDDIAGNSKAGEEPLSQAPELKETLTEKQRIQNVKRAKKLTQLFGDNPPTALFQITNFTPFVESNDQLGGAVSDGHPKHRDSLATIISISSLYGDTGQRIRDSFISVMTSSSGISAAMVSAEDEQERLPSEATGAPVAGPSVTTSEEPATAPAQSTSFAASAPPRSRLKRSSSSPTPSRPMSPKPRMPPLAVPPASFYPPRTPPTPPPFSNFMSTTGNTGIFTMETKVETTIEPAVSVEPFPDEFQARRRRAAKLSKFFGVEVNALADHLPNEGLPSRAGHPDAHMLPTEPLPVYVGAGKGPVRGPSVTVSKTRGYQDDSEELDMSQVIDKLRKMKSS